MQTTHFAYARSLDGVTAIVTVNNGGSAMTMDLPCTASGAYVGALSGARAEVKDGRLSVTVAANGGEIWIPAALSEVCNAPIVPVAVVSQPAPVKAKPAPEKAPEKAPEAPQPVSVPDKPYEEMTVEELQAVILEKMGKNGPVTEYMLGTVRDNTHHGSLVNWAKSFR